LADEISLLDHGYVKLITTYGSDESIIEAARMSTNKGFLGWGPFPCPKCEERETMRFVDISGESGCSQCGGTTTVQGDEKLLAYLWNNKHHTPFEMAGMIIEVQAPIMVFREWQRHRTQSYNELSARYTELPDLFYIPSIDRIMAGGQSKSNKQASGEPITFEDAITIQGIISGDCEGARHNYERLLKKGLSRELARLVIPVNQYSRMRASANLRNWLGFLSLRMAVGAQWEIRQYANAVASIVEAHFPRTYSLFKETNGS
jgi:thymidylate synthase (FAD)